MIVECDSRHCITLAYGKGYLVVLVLLIYMYKYSKLILH